MYLKIQYLPHYNKEWGLLEYKHQDDSGFDVRAAINETLVLKPMQRMLIPNGVRLALAGEENTQFEIQVRARSGLAIKHGIALTNGPATIDYGYRGELQTILMNLGDSDFIIQPGDRIAQAVICPIVRPQFQEVDNIEDDSTRGTGGFGSTGKQ